MVDISNVVNSTISAGETALGQYNTNAVLYLSASEPIVALSGSWKVYKNSKEVGTDYGTDSKVYADAVVFFGQAPNVLSGNGYLIVAPLTHTTETVDEVETDVVEDLDDALERISALVYFGGWLTDKAADLTEFTAAARYSETINTIGLIGGATEGSLEEGGLLYGLAALNLNHINLLYYNDLTAGTPNLRAFVAGYAGRMFSVNFAAQNSFITPNLKAIRGIVADKTVTETIYQTLATLGIDGYVDYGGAAKIIENANGNGLYFDDVYGRIWFDNTIKVEEFNTLATTPTKVPQTERGMDYLKRTARMVCQQAVYNGFLGAGTWNGDYPFGNPEDFARNISDFGFYIYSEPVASQTQTQRQTRKAPVIYIAGKQQGAIHSMDIITTFEA